MRVDLAHRGIELRVVPEQTGPFYGVANTNLCRRINGEPADDHHHHCGAAGGTAHRDTRNSPEQGLQTPMKSGGFATPY